MFAVLLLLLVVGPFVELYVIIQVAQVIGGWQTVLLLLVESVLGAWLMKRQGRGVLRRLDARLRASELPTKELVDGLLILLAGALMLTPGFLTDVVGFALLAPPTRAPIRAALMRRFRARLGHGFSWVRLGGLGGAGGPGGPARAGGLGGPGGPATAGGPNGPGGRRGGAGWSAARPGPVVDTTGHEGGRSERP
ncbi:MAG: FxsA family protein [Actinobacteria bacterium]|nr:FxsA family protein [Actinomycetota bacterium]